MKSIMKEMVGGCCVCAEEQGWDMNPLVYCDGNGCNVAVHQACYGIVQVPLGAWFCRKCESQERAVRVKCDLCPQKDGALKKTDTNTWCHVICALYIPEAWFGNTQTMEPIILKNVPSERFGKLCNICDDRGDGKSAISGACMSCNRAGCKQNFHVTCAQTKGLLCEEHGSSKQDNVKYCGYCPKHYKTMCDITDVPRKKDGSIKLIPAFRPVASNCGSDAGLTEEKIVSAGKQEKTKIRSSTSSVTSPLSVTPSKAQSKERVQMNANSVSESPRSDSPTLMYRVKTTQSQFPVATPLSSSIATSKSIGGRFTTANFIETTIVPSPANFGSISVDQKITLADNSALRSLPSATPPSTSDVARSAVSGMHTLAAAVATVAAIVSGPTSTAPSVTVLPATALSTVVSSFSNTYKSFVGQNLGVSIETDISPPQQQPVEVPSPSSPIELPRTKRRLPKATGDNSGKGAKKGKTDKNNGSSGGKAKTVKTLLETPSAASPPTLSPVYASPLLPASSKKTETATKRAISSIISRLSPTGEDEPSSSESHAANSSSQKAEPGETLIGSDLKVAPFVRPPPPTLLSGGATSATKDTGTSGSQMPTTMEQLLERQWEQGSQFLMEQGQHFDIASLLSCLYQLKAENHTLEENIATLTARRDHLLAVNARLSVPLAIPVIPSGGQHIPSTPTSSSQTASVSNDPDSSMILHPVHNSSSVVHDNGVFDDGPQSKHNKTARSNSTASNFTLLRETGIRFSSGHLPASTVGSSISSISGSIRSPLESNLSLLQPGSLAAAGFLHSSLHLQAVPPGGAVERGGPSSQHTSPTKKSRPTGLSAQSMPSGTSTAPQLSSFPMGPLGIIRPAAPGSVMSDSANMFSRHQQESMEQIQRQQQLIQQQLMLATGGQLTPEHQNLLFQLSRNAMQSGAQSLSAASGVLSAPLHQRTPAGLTSQQGMHSSEKGSSSNSGSSRKEKN